MAGGILGTGVSGLAAAQFGLDTTGHNIANVNTEGYSRQRVETASTVGNAFRSTFLGNGTQLASISRAFNQFNYEEVIFNRSQYNFNDTSYQNASRMDNLLADPDTGITTTFQELFDGISGVVEEPTIISSRNVVLSRAETVAKRFNALYEEVAFQHMGSVNEQIETSVTEINSITSEIALLNTKIQVENASGSQGFPPNDLLDKREKLVNELSGLLQVDTIDLPDGTINVTVGQGITLVTGSVSVPMVVERNKFDTGKLEIGVKANAGATNSLNVTDQLNGGSLSALIDVRDDLLLPAIRELGKLAIGLADTFNRQQSLGRDLNGDEGTNLFADVNDPQQVLARTLNSADNPNTTNFEVYIRNTSQLSSENYSMEYDGVTLDVTNENGDLIQQFTAADIATMSGAGRQALTIGETGLEISIELNNLAAGDEFQIRPTFYGSRNIERVLDEPELVAAADNYFQLDSSVNPNEVSISLYEIQDINDASYPSPDNVPPLPDPTLQIVIDATGTQYDIQDSTGASVVGGFQNLASDQIIEGAGLRVKLTGTLAGNEVFSITHADNTLIPNTDKQFGKGDNVNMLSMLNFQTERQLDGSTNTFSESYADLVTMVGVETKSRSISRDSFHTLLVGAEERLAGVQGVNLDEEAANLIQYQQAYAAAARIITVSRETFQSLLSAAG